ncbi:MAG: hypothetical protein KF896_14450 [Ignavibacteriae bacterium]|nr:hypothetical protein [Ignavibacteriota bacterium]
MELYSPITDGLVFSMQGGTLFDSAKNNVITNNGATLTTDHNGRAGRGWAFASSRQISFPILNTYSNIENVNTTIISLKTGSDVTTRQGVFITMDTTAARFYIQILFEKIIFGTRDGSGGHNNTASALTANTQYHFAFVNLGHSVGKVIYVNGVPAAALAGEVLASGLNDSVIIGGTNGVIANPMLGTTIDTVACYSRDLTATEIQYNYNWWLSH